MIQFQRNGQSINVYANREHVLYFSTTDGRNPSIRLLRSDTNLETMLHVLELIRKLCNHEPIEVEWKQ
jgi:hypothetical protein